MKKLLFHLSLFLLVGTISAQDTLKDRVSKNMAYLAIGLSYLNELNLNKVLSDNTISSISRIYAPVTAGFCAYKKKFGCTMEGSVMNGLSDYNQSRMTVILGRFGMNYLFVDTKKYFMAIGLNYCYQDVTAKVYNQTENFISVSNISSSNGGIIELKNYSHSIGFAICSGFLVGKSTSYVKIGYDYSVTNNPWKVTNSSVQDFPRERFSSLYLMMSLGLRSFSKK